jgi:hypothetical protein
MTWFQSRVLGIIFCSFLVGLSLNASEQGKAETASVTGGQADTNVTSGSGNTFSVTASTGAPGTAVPLEVHLPAAFKAQAASKTAYTFLMFKGVPEDFTLSAGFRTRNTWLVSIEDIRGLKIEIPQGFQGALDIDIYLYRGKDAPPDRSTVHIPVLSSPGSLTSATDATEIPSTAKQNTVAQRPPEPMMSKEEEKALFAQGETQLKDGNIVFARLMFEELVSRGNVRALFELARTYDPDVLQELGAVGIQGDAEKAKELYRKASEFAGIPAPK